MTWEEAVSQLRELGKEAQDFTNRLEILASLIQRMCRDEEMRRMGENSVNQEKK